MNEGLLNHFGLKADQIDTTKSPLEQIFESKIQKKEDIKPPNAPTVTVFEVDGYHLPGDVMTVLVYTLIKALGQKKEVKKILDTFKFRFMDLTGKQIYPRTKKLARKR